MLSPQLMQRYQHVSSDWSFCQLFFKDNKNLHVHFSAKLIQFQICYSVKSHSLVIRLNTQHVTDSISHHSVIYCIQNCTVSLYSSTEKKKKTYWISQIKYRWLANCTIKSHMYSRPGCFPFNSIHSLNLSMDINQEIDKRCPIWKALY